MPLITNWSKFNKVGHLNSKKEFQLSNINRRPKVEQLKPVAVSLGRFAVNRANASMNAGTWKLARPSIARTSNAPKRSMLHRIGKLVAFLSCDHCNGGEVNLWTGRPAGGYGRVYILDSLNIPGHEGTNRWCHACGSKWRK